MTDDDACDHVSWSGDEGPVATLGRMPTRWRCDGCGVVAEERSVCLSCARDTYPGQPLAQSCPTTPRMCHVCRMTTELGYSLPLGVVIHGAKQCAGCFVDIHGGHNTSYRHEDGRLYSATCHDCEARYDVTS